MEDQTPIADKALLFRKKGMTMVNALFILSVFFYKSRFILIAYFAWLVYLIYRIKNAGKEESRVVYYVLLVLPVGMICVNLFYLLRM